MSQDNEGELSPADYERLRQLKSRLEKPEKTSPPAAKAPLESGIDRKVVERVRRDFSSGRKVEGLGEAELMRMQEVAQTTLEAARKIIPAIWKDYSGPNNLIDIINQRKVPNSDIPILRDPWLERWIETATGQNRDQLSEATVFPYVLFEFKPLSYSDITVRDEAIFNSDYFNRVRRTIFEIGQQSRFFRMKDKEASLKRIPASPYGESLDPTTRHFFGKQKDGAEEESITVKRHIDYPNYYLALNFTSMHGDTFERPIGFQVNYTPNATADLPKNLS